EMTSEALDELGWNPAYHEVSGWHEHPDYVELRADNLREFVEGRGLTLGEDAELVFSAHGTPVKYLEDGSRYRDYVEEYCEWIADRLEVDDYLLGYQNHENRDVEWTQPDTEDVVEEVDAPNVVVEPLSFMREQSETLSELDLELREECDEAGVELHRVPIPHDDPRFAGVLADLVEPLLMDYDLEDWGMGLCRCRETDRTYCYGPADD
ncbi:MAG: ferrochelatase, partial [Halobacteriales archaeon]